MKKYITSGTLGIGIGSIISLIMSTIFGDGNYLPVNPFSTMGSYYYERFTPVTVMAISLALWFMIGLVFQVTDLCFEQDWSLLRISATHFLGTAIGFTGLAILAGWFPLNLASLLLFWLIYIAIYAVIYLINYRQMKAQIARINKTIGA